MKYSKSAAPYLAILFTILIGIPLANYQMQATQQIVVEIEFQKPTVKKAQLANSKIIEKKPATLLLMSSK